MNALHQQQWINEHLTFYCPTPLITFWQQYFYSIIRKHWECKPLQKINKKHSWCCDSRSYCIRHTVSIGTAWCVDNMSIYLFTVSNWSLLLLFSWSLRSVAKWYILQQVSEEVNRSALLGTWCTTFNPYTDPEHQNAQRHRRTDRRWYHANSRSHCMQQYNWLKINLKRKYNPFCTTA